MKPKILLSYSILLALSLLTACSSGWEKYLNEKAGFMVDMPGNPKVESNFERLSQTSTLTSTTYTAAPSFSGESYLVYVGNYSSWSLGGVTFNLENGKQGMRDSIAQQGGSIISEGESQVADHNAWEFKIKVKDMEGSLRVFVEDKTIYGLQVLHKEGKDVSANAERFFSSFSLLSKE